MEFNRRTIVFEAADMEAESTFWAGLLDGTVETKDNWHDIRIDGEWDLAVQLTPDYVAPVWPDGTPTQQLHLDFYLEDLEAAREGAGVGRAAAEVSRRPGHPHRVPGLRRSGRPHLLPRLAVGSRWKDRTRSPFTGHGTGPARR